MIGPVEVLDFWFADSLTNSDTLAERRAIWFMGGSDVDQLITEMFGTLPDAALAHRNCFYLKSIKKASCSLPDTYSPPEGYNRRCCSWASVICSSC